MSGSSFPEENTWLRYVYHLVAQRVFVLSKQFKVRFREMCIIYILKEQHVAAENAADDSDHI